MSYAKAAVVFKGFSVRDRHHHGQRRVGRRTVARLQRPPGHGQKVQVDSAAAQQMWLLLL
jgi:hypothetical protein